MNTREIASEYRKSQWAQKIKEQKSSGQSIREWCETNGIQRHQFFYWQRKLRETVVKDLAVQGYAQPSPPDGWALCSTMEEPPKGSPKGLTIEIGNCRVVVETEFEPELLKEVCSVLSSIC